MVTDNFIYVLICSVFHIIRYLREEIKFPPNLIENTDHQIKQSFVICLKNPT